MVKGIGTDIVEIERIQKAIAKNTFIEKVYTKKEQEYADSRGSVRSASYAARFAGKEAVAKAFGTGFTKGGLTDIEIINDDLGCPQVSLYGYFLELANENKIDNVQISLSHSREYATAVCILEGI